MKLYYSPGACSLSPHIALREAGLPFDLVQVDLGTKKTKDGADFTKINPNGYVPALQLGDNDVLTEGPAIVQYIADQKPDSGLFPKAGGKDRYHAQETLNFITTELHKTIGSLFSKDMPDAYKPVVQKKAMARLAHVDGRLASKPFLLGDKFSVADGYLFTVAGWGQHVGLDISPLKNLSGFMGRVAQRPAVQAALKAEGLGK
ncbi:MAG: glutathione transferase GstA [Dongiaceae bacterium]